MVSKKVVCVCLQMLMFISCCFALPFSFQEEMIEVSVLVYPYWLYSAILGIISLCGINFILLTFLINRIKSKKTKNILLRFAFIVIFVIAFCMAQYLEGISSYIIEYVPRDLDVDFRTMNFYSPIINLFISFVFLLDIVILVVETLKVRANKIVKSEKSND